MYSQQAGLHELHDVLITSPLDKQVIKYDAASSLWVNGVASGGVTTGATPPASPNAGDAWYDTTDGLLYIWYVDADSSQWVEVKANSALETTLLTRVATLEANQTPSGVIMQFAGVTAPAGYLLCDGTAVSRTTYAGLFTAISTTYGSGDGSSTFNLPDLRGRVPVGKNGGTFGTIGATGGAETHTLTEAQMPSHTHVQNSHNHTQNSHNHTQNPHTHSVTWLNNINVANFTGAFGSIGSNASGNVNSTTATNNATTATNNATTATNQNTGGGEAHNNLQPYQVVNYIIKATAAVTPGESELAPRVGELETAQSTTNKSGLVPVVPTSVVVGSGSASVNAVGLATFTGATHVTLNGVFSSAYAGYKILFSTTANSATGTATYRFAQGGTATTAGNWYGAGFYYGINGTDASLGKVNAGAEIYCQSFLGTGYANLNTVSEITIYNGRYTLQATGFPNGPGGVNAYALWNGVTTSLDGFRVAVNTGNFTGTVQVYGLR
jgi:microcystin-dependent protein